MTLKGNAKLEEKRTLGSEIAMRNLKNFNASSGKSENLHSDVLLLSIAYKVSAKKYGRIFSHDTKERSKVWRKTDFLFEKRHENFG